MADSTSEFHLTSFLSPSAASSTYDDVIMTSSRRHNVGTPHSSLPSSSVGNTSILYDDMLSPITGGGCGYTPTNHGMSGNQRLLTSSPASSNHRRQSSLSGKSLTSPVFNKKLISPGFNHSFSRPSATQSFCSPPLPPPPPPPSITHCFSQHLSSQGVNSNSSSSSITNSSSRHSEQRKLTSSSGDGRLHLKQAKNRPSESSANRTKSIFEKGAGTVSSSVRTSLKGIWTVECMNVSEWWRECQQSWIVSEWYICKIWWDSYLCEY